MNGTIYVVGLVMGSDRSLPVPRGIVETPIESSGQDGRMRFEADLSVGQRVTLVSGPFADIIGQLERLDELGRVRILLDMMGAAVLIWTGAERVGSAPPKSPRRAPRGDISRRCNGWRATRLAVACLRARLESRLRKTISCEATRCEADVGDVDPSLA